MPDQDMIYRPTLLLDIETEKKLETCQVDPQTMGFSQPISAAVASFPSLYTDANKEKPSFPPEHAGLFCLKALLFALPGDRKGDGRIIACSNTESQKASEHSIQSPLNAVS